MQGGAGGTEGRPAQELSLGVRRSRLISSPALWHPGSHPPLPPSLVLAPTLPLPLGSNKGTGPPPPAQGRAVPQSTGAGAGVQREPTGVQWHRRSPGPGPAPGAGPERPAKGFRAPPPPQPACRAGAQRLSPPQSRARAGLGEVTAAAPKAWGRGVGGAASRAREGIRMRRGLEGPEWLGSWGSPLILEERGDLCRGC